MAAQAAAANNEALKNQLQKQEASKDPARSLLKSMEAEIKLALPSLVSDETWLRGALTVLKGNPKLLACDKYSLLAAMMNAAQIGLELTPALGQVYLVPYGNQVQFIIGYRGLIELAYRSGMVQKVEARGVCENDAFELSFGEGGHIKHVPLVNGDRGATIGYYAIVTLNGGAMLYEYSPKENIIKHAQQFSKSYNNGPWQTSFGSMAEKTVLRDVIHRSPLSVELKSKLSNEGVITGGRDENNRLMPVVAAQGDILDGEYTVDTKTGEVKQEAAKALPVGDPDTLIQ